MLISPQPYMEEEFDEDVIVYLGYTHFKLLIWRVDDCSVWSTSTDETDTLRKIK